MLASSVLFSKLIVLFVAGAETWTLEDPEEVVVLAPEVGGARLLTPAARAIVVRSGGAVLRSGTLLLAGTAATGAALLLLMVGTPLLEPAEAELADPVGIFSRVFLGGHCFLAGGGPLGGSP